jgi:DNA-binding CsgD family transcriptional regulator/tetratricopeptide (TPR) repeat protein
MTQRVSSPVFVGRAPEMAALREALRRAEDGHPASAVITGEAGVGKSRLVAEFGAEAAATGALVLSGPCPPLAGGLLPYAPLASALRTLAEDPGPLSRRRLDDRALLPLAVLVPNRAIGAAPAAGTDSPRELMEPLLELVRRVSADQTVVLVIEDLHWADPSTLDFVAFLLRNLRHGRLVLVGTVRTDDLHRGHPLLPVLAELERFGVERLELAPFVPEEMTRQLTGILQQPPAPEVAARIYARSAGNPFFAEELLAADAAGQALPVGLRDLLLARIHALSPAAQRVLETVAVAARPVEHDLLVTVTELADDALLTSLREAVEHHVLVAGGHKYAFRHALVQEAVHGDLLPGERVRLHRLFGEAITERPELFGESATGPSAALAHHWCEARDFSRALPATIAAGLAAEKVTATAESLRYFRLALELWERAYQPDRPPALALVDLHRHAAEAAHLLGEDAEAIALTRAAIALVDEHAQPVEAGLLYERLGRYLYTGGSDELATLSAYQRAVALVPDEVRAERARVLAAMGQALMLSCRFRESRPYCEKAVTVARRLGAAGEEVSATVTLATDLCHDDEESEQGIALLRRSLVMALEVGALEEAHRAYANLGEALTDKLRLDEAAKLFDDGAVVAEKSGFIGAGSALRCDVADTLLLAGRWDEVDRHLAHAGSGRRHRLTHARFHLRAATLHLRRGHFDRAHAHVADLRHYFPAGGQIAEVSEWHAIVAEMALWERRPADARHEIAQALPAVQAGDNTYILALLLWLGLRAEADLAERTISKEKAHHSTTAGRTVAGRLFAAVRALPRRLHPVPRATVHLLLAAAEHTRFQGRSDPRQWQVAAERLEQEGCAYLAAYSRWRQAEAVMGGSRNRASARRLLLSAYATACRLGAAPLGEEIEALARRSRIDLDPVAGETLPGKSGVKPGSAADTFGLTAREADVLAQLTAGHTNRQIAEALYISEKTVATHVSHILAKLDVTNRSQAAAAAHRLGLDPAS